MKLTGGWSRSRAAGRPLKGLADNPVFQWWRAPNTVQPHSTWGRADDAAALGETAAAMQDLGVERFRFEVPWRELQPMGPRRYAWQKLDTILDALERRGIDPLPVVTYTPAWAMASADTTGAAMPRDPGLFGDLMAALARRYRGRCSFWELWNEPDHPHSWSGALRDYVRLILEPGATAVRAADPGATIVLGGLAHHRNLEAIHAAGGGPSYDVASIHNYPRRPSPWTVNRVVRQTRSVLRRAGLPRELWLTECGIASREPSLPSSFGTSTDEESQASFVRGVFDSVRADAIFVYQLRDTVIFDAAGKRLKEVFWGLTDETGARRKPAYEAFCGVGLNPGRRPPGSNARTPNVRPSGR